jgi:hypothetical protein
VVKVTLLIAEPSYTLRGYTAVGTLHGVRHAPATVNGVLVPAWTEIVVWELPTPRKGN